MEKFNPCDVCLYTLAKDSKSAMCYRCDLYKLKREKDSLIRTYKECITEAIKDFAERLKTKSEPFYTAIGLEKAVNTIHIDNLVKEMTGGGSE